MTIVGGEIVYDAGTIVGISAPPDANHQNLPESFQLLQNYPNPFNPTTTIRYKLPIDSHVVLTVYNVSGQEIITLIDKDQKAGDYDIQWEASAYPSGLYIFQLKAESENKKPIEKIKKMLLLK
jgi:hypothetical protein